MEKPTSAILSISFFLLLFSTVGGALLASRLAGDNAGYGSIVLGTIGASLIFFVQVALYRMIHNRLLFAIVFSAALLLTLAWIMFCLFMPILWMDSLPVYAKTGVVCILLLLSVLNCLKGRSDFLRSWSSRPDRLQFGNLDPVKGTIAWEKVLLSLKQEPDLYIPGLPRRLSAVTGVLLVGFMLIGLTFRTAFTVFSAFAWGIPSAVITAFVFQLIGQKMGEARKVREIQAELMVELQSASAKHLAKKLA